MKCQHCNSEDLGKAMGATVYKKYIKSGRKQANRVKRYFKYCRSCGYNSYFFFPDYLDESQFDNYLKHTNQKGDNSVE